MTMHADEMPVDHELVRELVDRDRPEWADLPLTQLPASGSTNSLWRLGPELLVRLPRLPGGSATIVTEARWVPELAAALPVAVPRVVHVGEPGAGYPERWSVVGWLAGDVPTPGGVGDSAGLARDLAAVVVALGGIVVPVEALTDPALQGYRAEPLAGMAETVTEAVAACLSILDLDLDLDAAEREWQRVLALPGADRPHPPRWVHADLVAENLLVSEGRLSAVLDFGGLCVGDPAVDLGVAWELLGPADRELFRTASGASDEDWALGRGWALALALNTLPYYWRSMPERCRARLVAARAVLE